MSQFFDGHTVQLSKHDGATATEVSSDSLSGKYVMFYFSAHWCPPCRAFTPVLAEFYKANHESLNFEIVFVSSDKDDGAFNEYWGTMPWLGLPFANRELKDSVCFPSL
jgi:nucleoredoxin